MQHSNGFRRRRSQRHAVHLGVSEASIVESRIVVVVESSQGIIEVIFQCESNAVQGSSVVDSQIVGIIIVELQLQFKRWQGDKAAFSENGGEARCVVG